MLQTRNEIPKVANTSLGKIFRLVLIGTVPPCLEKNYERYRFSGKAPPGPYIVLRTRKKKSQSRKYFFMKNFSTGRNDPIRLRKKLETESPFRKSPYRPTCRAPNSKRNSQSRKYFIRKNFSTGTYRNGPPMLRKKL